MHRIPDKRFRQSGYIKGSALFLADRIGEAPVVHVSEGEDCVCAIEAAGGVAVCSAMGAGKAHFADWSPLSGRHAVIIADKDDAGRSHAEQVAERVAPIALSVAIVEAAVGKDAADHIAAGYPLEGFLLVRQVSITGYDTAGDDETVPTMGWRTPDLAALRRRPGGRRSSKRWRAEICRKPFEHAVSAADQLYLALYANATNPVLREASWSAAAIALGHQQCAYLSRPGATAD